MATDDFHAEPVSEVQAPAISTVEEDIPATRAVAFPDDD